MCTNGVNTNQLKATVEQIDETIALTRRWTHRLYHFASDGQMERATKQLEHVQRMLDDVRAALDETQDAIDKDDAEFNGGSVTRV